MKVKIRKTKKHSYTTCDKCGGTYPLFLAWYQRVRWDKKENKWKPRTQGICMCDKRAYDFYVVGLAEERNKDLEKNFPPYIRELARKTRTWKQIPEH